YCFIRFAEKETARGGPLVWCCASWLACLLGMATKEAMVTAPILVLLYDGTFVAGSVAEAWKRRRPYYLGIGASWVLLLFIVASEQGVRGNAAGFGQGMSSMEYLAIQCWAIPHYLRLVFWPHPLILDYGIFRPATADVIQPGLILAVLVG